jgi:uroporphyrinogen-III synthase
MSELRGHTVLVTRAAEDFDAWAERLTGAGALPIALPCIHGEAIDDPTLATTLGAESKRADWLVFTSRRGVDAYAALVPGPLAETARVAVVGTATAAAAKDRLGRADLTSEAGTAASLARALAERVAPGTRVVIAVAENAGVTLEEALEAAGAAVTRVDVYRTVPMPPLEPKRPLSALGAANVLLASPSAVTGFVNQVDLDVAADIYTIGPSTTVAAEAAGLAVKAQAEYPSLDGLMEAMRCAS